MTIRIVRIADWPLVIMFKLMPLNKTATLKKNRAAAVYGAWVFLSV